MAGGTLLNTHTQQATDHQQKPSNNEHAPPLPCSSHAVAKARREAQGANEEGQALTLAVRGLVLSEGEGAHNCTAADSSADHETHTSDSEYSDPGILDRATVSCPHCVLFRWRVQFWATSATAGRKGQREGSA